MIQKETRLKVSLDIDDVVLDFFSQLLRYGLLRIPPFQRVNPFSGDISSWFGLTKEEFKQFHEEFASSPYYDSMPLMEGFDVVFPLLSSRYTLLGITARSAKRKERTLNCIRQQVPLFNLPLLEFISFIF